MGAIKGVNMIHFKTIMHSIEKFQQSQENDALTEYAIVFLLSSIILLSIMSVLVKYIDSHRVTSGLF